MALRDSLEPANKRAASLLASIPKAISAQHDHKSGRIVIDLSSKLALSFSPCDAQGLENATPSQLEEIEISPSGFGIHFPKLDADLYVPALLEGSFGSRKWMVSRLGRVGGRSRSRAKPRLLEQTDGWAGDQRRQSHGNVIA